MPNYSGIWNISSQANAKAAGTWPTAGPALYSWGRNTYGGLGLGNTTKYSSPKQVGSLKTWLTVSGAYAQTVAVKTDGTLWSWGRSNYGQLGLGNTTSYSSPKQVGSLTNWLNALTYDYHSFALKTDGTLWAWGTNAQGALGLGNTTSYSSPKQVGALTTWSAIAANIYAGYAIRTDGTLWSWGYASITGKLGLGNTTNYSSPVQVGGLTNWLKIAAFGYVAAAVKTNGTLWTWGTNATYGTLGLNDRVNRSSPTQVGVLTNWSNIYCGYRHMVAVKTDGTLWSWGDNTYGQLGIGTSGNYYSSPKQVGSLTNWLQAASGKYNNIVIKTDGSLWSWGYNADGQLGQGNTTNLSSPKQIGTLTNWLKVSFDGYGGIATATSE